MSKEIARAGGTGWLGLIGVAIGLGLVGLAFATPFLFGSRTLEAEPLLREHFAFEAAPLGMELKRALLLPMGERLILFAKPDDSGEVIEHVLLENTPSAEITPPPTSPSAKPSGMTFFDWSTLAEGPKGSPPSQVAIVWFPRAMAEGVMRNQFWNAAGGGFNFVGAGGGSSVLDGGELAWGGFSAPFVRERKFVLERKNAKERRFFRESMRVNLSVKDAPCVLYAIWDEGLPAGKAELEEVLSAFPPR